MFVPFVMSMMAVGMAAQIIRLKIQNYELKSKSTKIKFAMRSHVNALDEEISKIINFIEPDSADNICIALNNMLCCFEQTERTLTSVFSTNYHTTNALKIVKYMPLLGIILMSMMAVGIASNYKIMN